MRKALGICAAVFAAATLSASPALATQPGTVTGDYVEDGHKVTICHRTGSATNPYVIITVDVAAIDGVGASDHDHHEMTGNGLGGDVIPPVPGYNDGKNWNWAENGNWAAGDVVTPDLCVAKQSS